MSNANNLRKANANLRNALGEISEAEMDIMKLCKGIVERLIYVRQRAVENNALTLVSDLEEFIKELTNIFGQVKDKKIKKDLEVLIGYVQSFINEYKNAGLSGSFKNSEERVKAFLISIGNALSKTILKDLREKDALLDRLKTEIRRSAL